MLLEILQQFPSYFIIICSFILYITYKSLSEKPIIITIDGNIGSGKSTFINILKKHFSNKIYFAKEPVDEWMSLKDKNGTNILEKFYKDKNRWGYTFQNLAFITRTLEMDRALNSGKKVIISERSVMTDYNIFAKMLYEEGAISKIEMDIYNFWYNKYSKYETFNIYLKTSVSNCQERINKRNRHGEENGISLSYLEKLQKLHDDWLLNLPDDMIMVINGNNNFINDTQLQKDLIKKICRKFDI